MAFAKLNFDARGEMLEDAKQYNKEEINENEEKYQEFLDQYGRFQEKLDNLRDKLNISPDKEKVEEEAEKDSKTYANKLQKGLSQKLSDFQIDLKQIDIGDMIDAKRSVPAPKITMPEGLKQDINITPKGTDAWEEMKDRIAEARREYELFGNKSEFVRRKQEILRSAIIKLTGDYDSTNNAIQRLRKRYDKLTESQNKSKNKTGQLNETQREADKITRKLTQTTQRFATEGISMLGERMGNLVTQQASGMEKFLLNIAAMVGDFLKKMGTAIVSYGIAMEGFKKAFENPLGAIIAGTALIATGQIVKNMANQGLEGMASGGVAQKQGAFVVGEKGPEIVNLPKGSKVNSNQQSQRMLSNNKGKDEFEVKTFGVKGDTILFALEKAKQKNKRLKG
jgi:DNA repair ATPase RecN